MKDKIVKEKRDSLKRDYLKPKFSHNSDDDSKTLFRKRFNLIRNDSTLLQHQQVEAVLILQIKYHHVLIVISGILGVLALLILQTIYVGKTSKQIQHLPADSFLQVRDDFAIYAYSRVDDLNNLQQTTQLLNAFYNKRDNFEAENDANIKEALSSLRLAIEMMKYKKIDKAGRLLEHAYALAPKHPEVLLRYGEYLEYSQRNVVLADQYYYQALILNPDNTEALSNRQRTAEIVHTLDENHLNELDRKRDALSAVSESNAALRRAKKEAYFQHIYHSVGIEGNTMTLAQTRSILETRTAVDGKSIDEHNEILGLDLAMKFINDSLVNKMEITAKDILDIHRRVLGHVDPIEGGEFRRSQVYVGGHTPPGPGDLSILMRHFENWLNSERALNLHPIKLAALAHYKLVHIHPFIDGNGRTSRLLMNTLLMRNGYPPVIIPKQQRHKYYQYLQIANDGDIRPFVRFIAQCTEKTLDLYLWATSDLPQQIPMVAQTENTLANIEQLLVTPSSSKTEPIISKTTASKTNWFTSSEIDYFESGSGAIP